MASTFDHHNLLHQDSSYFYPRISFLVFQVTFLPRDLPYQDSIYVFLVCSTLHICPAPHNLDFTPVIILSDLCNSWSFLVIWYPKLSTYLIPLCPMFSPSTLFSDTWQFVFFPQNKRLTFHTHTKLVSNLFLYILVFSIVKSRWID